MDLEEMKKLPPREFTEKSYKAYKEGRITAEQLKGLSIVYLKANNLWEGK